MAYSFVAMISRQLNNFARIKNIFRIQRRFHTFHQVDFGISSRVRQVFFFLQITDHMQP
jgi:hypothetical protein